MKKMTRKEEKKTEEKKEKKKEGRMTEERKWKVHQIDERKRQKEE